MYVNNVIGYYVGDRISPDDREATQPEIASLQLSKAKASKQAEIDAIESKAYMRRGQRETWLLNVTDKFTLAGYTHAQVYSTNPEYKRVYDENVLATQYRAELKAIV